MANNRKPTFRELSSVWKRMAESNSPSFHQRDINNAVEDAVLAGDLPREAADYAKVLAVYAEELIRERGRPQGGTGKETVYRQDQIFHLRFLSLDGMNGVVPATVCRDAIALARALEQHGGAYFGNGARPGGVGWRSAGSR
jgi:hypothetical protein